jgi:PKD repeat protein
MRTFGIKSSGLLIIFVCLQNFANSQSNINPCLCNRKECGDIVASFKLVSNSTVVCDGYEFEVQNNSTIPDVSYYIWSWGDGTRDSVTTTANQKHIYNIPSDKVCTDNQTTYQICLLAVKRCGSGFSCHNNNSPVTVIHRPVAKFDYTQTVCRDKVVNFTNKSCNVDKQIAGAYLWTFHDGTTSTSENTSKTYTAPGTYNVKLKVKNGCSEHEITQVINVVDFPNAVVNISAEAQDSIVCVNDRVTMINRSNQWSSIKWIFPANTVLTDTTKWKIVNIGKVVKGLNNNNRQLKLDSLAMLDTIVFDVLKAGNYRFEMISRNACGDKKWTWNLKVLDVPNITLNSPPQFCERADYTPSITVPNDSLTYQWSFPGGNPSSFSGKTPGTIKYEQPGNYEVTLEVTGVCNTLVRKVNVVVNSRNPVKIIEPMKVFCKNGGPDTLRVDRAGGVWSGPGIVNTSRGIFNPTNLNPGKYEIVYTIGPMGCQSIDRIMVEVVNSAVVTASDKTLCENEAATQLTANPPGGLWSGNTALSSAGIFSPLVSKIGSYDVTYTYRDFNQCVTQKNSQNYC